MTYQAVHSSIKRFLWISILIIVALTSCLPATTTPEEVSQPTITPTLTPTKPPDYMAWEQTIVGEGSFGRNDYCSSSFSYQYRTIGRLTVAISNHFDEIAQADEIYAAIFQEFNQLTENSHVDFQNNITVFVIPESTVKNCKSYDSFVFTSPERIGSFEIIEDVIGASAGISEPWVKAGLAYLASEKEIDQQMLREWYQDTDDLDLLGFFPAYFMTDWVSDDEINIARMTAASLIEFIVENENENFSIELIEGQADNNLRNQWLSSIGVQRSVEYAYDGFYEPFQISQSNDCSLLVKSEIITFCLNRLPESRFFDKVADAEQLIFRAYNGYRAITEYLVANAPSISPTLEPNETITIEVSQLDRVGGYSRGNVIKILDFAAYFSVLHEVVHTYGWNVKLGLYDYNFLLTEGFAEYLGRLLPIYQQPVKEQIWMDVEGWTSSPGISAWFFLDEEQLDTAKDWYLQQGGSLEYQDAVDARLFYDAISYATMYRDAYGGPMGISIEEAYSRSNLLNDRRLEDAEGLDLSYTQAASYVAWLCDTYSLDQVMQKYVNNEKGTELEGKDFDVLKEEWLAYLMEKGSGIPIPDSPQD